MPRAVLIKCARPNRAAIQVLRAVCRTLGREPEDPAGDRAGPSPPGRSEAAVNVLWYDSAAITAIGLDDVYKQGGVVFAGCGRSFVGGVFVSVEYSACGVVVGYGIAAGPQQYRA